MARRSRTYLPLVALAVAGVAAGGLWAVFVPPQGQYGGEAVERELADLREAEAQRRPAARAAGAPALCGALDVRPRGNLRDAELQEVSGLVASRRTRGLLWAIEDSGADPVLTALRENGTTAGRWTVPGAENQDWEDIAAGPGPSGPVLYAADIGDNREARDAVVVYRVPEPASAAGGGTTAPPARLELRYPDGAHDAEALIVDPRRGTLLIFTKGLEGAGIYAASNPPFGRAASAPLKKVADGPLALATAADVSADGTTVALRGYFSLVVWQRSGNEPLTQTVRRKPCTSATALTDGQGEALALSRGGTTAWTIAEGTNPPVLRLSPER
ncbi:MAG: hypothetical protein JHD16_16925 [Solirubrobacteraceae bacterium]|nr:hypothetical protein [Solirubrobacteraceae bacterium]